MLKNNNIGRLSLGSYHGSFILTINETDLKDCKALLKKGVDRGILINSKEERFKNIETSFSKLEFDKRPALDDWGNWQPWRFAYYHED